MSFQVCELARIVTISEFYVSFQDVLFGTMKNKGINQISLVLLTVSLFVVVVCRRLWLQLDRTRPDLSSFY